MKFTHMDSKPNLPNIQDEVIEFWKENDVFKESVDKESKGEIVFYDGPPFPTGKPHHGTVLVSFIKDMVARYWTMRGYSVPRQWGWDCHGLPIETQVEQRLGLTSKIDIEKKLGIGKFNDECYNLVNQNNDAWREYVDQMARWVDYDGSYMTLDTNYMESVIWAFKQCYDKGYIYKDYRVTPYCHHCQTSLSISDTRESDSTRPKQDTWVMAKFDTDCTFEGVEFKFLAWTTTPWTLPSNMALAVGEAFNYEFVEALDGNIYVVCQGAKDRYEKIFGKNANVVKTCKGKDLVDMKYKPLFNYFADKANEGAFRVIGADFVDANDGIGVVHIAPAFGEDDYWACRKNKVPLVNPVDEKGCFSSDVTDFAGENVLDINKEVIRFLRASELIVDFGSIEHNYPHCWRCRTPLIYKAMDAWYFDIDKVKARLAELNMDINWIPETVKHGRFGNWLENARDWNISRNRYWSTPLPVWECPDCGKRVVLGSIDEIYEKSGVKLTDLHRQYMDEVTFECEHCHGTMKRIPEVLDCWFESGSVPFARLHYPFDNKEWFEKNITSDFVVEYTGQIRCWFYYLLVLSGALFDKPPFKNAIVHGTILAKDGRKLSKSSKNYTDPMELMRKYGTDSFRLYLYRSNAMLIGDLLFNEAGILESLQEVILPLWNACSFFTSYANIDGYEPSENIELDSTDLLDKWLLASIYDCNAKVTASMDSYKINEFVEPIIQTIDGLTNWYIRRSRRRFWANGLSEDKKKAYDTLYYALLNIIKMLAPVTPIISEKLYKILTGKKSVHLDAWPQVAESCKNDNLLDEVELTIETIHLARSIRTKHQVKTRQPLSKLQVALADKTKLAVVQKYQDTICEELNVKKLETIENVEEIVNIVYKPNFATLKVDFPAQMPNIMKAVKSKKIAKVDGGFELTFDNGSLVLDDKYIIVEYQAKNNTKVMSGNGIVVDLDLEITEELANEGIARDIVRNIQDGRKQIGCKITDNISVCIEGNYPTEWAEYINRETLSAMSTFEDAKFTCDILNNNEETITIKIK